MARHPNTDEATRRLQLEGAQERTPLVGGLVSLGMGGIAFGASFVVGGC